MAIYKANHTNILLAAEKIKNGELVAFPTETVYGLGADGLNSFAVAKIFETKKRPVFNPLILHINSLEQLHQIAKFNNRKAELLINKFWPGPLTFVFKKKNIVPGVVTAGNDTVAVRMPADKIALELIFNAGTPIAAPSANEFGKLSPTTALHVEEQLGKKIDFILDGGKCEVGVESTILQITGEKIILLRPGGLPIEEIESTIHEKVLDRKSTDNINSPGLLKSHYAPITPIKFIDEVNLTKYSDKKVGAIFLSKNNLDFDFTKIKILSLSSNLREATSNLFVFLHELEKDNLDLIVCEKIEKTGLGNAIMDRLQKAVNKYS